MAKTILDISEAQFDMTVLKNERPAIVDFWAPWCSSCRAIGLVIEALAEQHRDNVVTCKVNVDNNPMAALRYGIHLIPAVLVFKDGEVVDKVFGAAQRNAFSRLYELAGLKLHQHPRNRVCEVIV